MLRSDDRPTNRGLLTNPICAVCHKPVESVTRIHNMSMKVWEFRAYCHGEVDVCEISEAQVFAMAHNGTIVAGEAFVDRGPLVQVDHADGIRKLAERYLRR